MTESIFTFTHPAIMAHPTLITPRAFKNKKTGKELGEAKFGASFVLDRDHPDLAPFKALCVEVARSAGANPKEVAKWPFKSGTKLADDRKAVCEAAGKTPDGEYQRDKAVIAGRSKFPPSLAFLEGKRIVELDNETAIKNNAGKFYFGVLALPRLALVFTDIDGKKQVSAYLNMVLSLNKGQRLGATRSAAEVFKGYAGQVSDIDPTDDDDIPF